MKHGGYIAMRAEAEVKLIMQTETEPRAKLQMGIAAGLLLHAELDAAKQSTDSFKVSQMLLMLFCLHESSVMLVHRYASLTLPTPTFCMTQSDLLTER